MRTIDNKQLELNFDLEINDFGISRFLDRQQSINQRIAEKREYDTTLSNLDFQYYNYLYDTILNIADDIASNEYAQQIINDNIEDKDAIINELHNYYWTNDNITGNGSGSWWFWTYLASLAVFENLEEIADIYNEYGFYLGDDLANQSWEKIDVTTRCYYLSEALNIVLDTFFEVNEIEA